MLIYSWNEVLRWRRDSNRTLLQSVSFLTLLSVQSLSHSERIHTKFMKSTLITDSSVNKLWPSEKGKFMPFTPLENMFKSRINQATDLRRITNWRILNYQCQQICKFLKVHDSPLTQFHLVFHNISTLSYLILSSTLRLVFTSSNSARLSAMEKFYIIFVLNILPFILHLIIITLLSEEYKLWSSYLGNFLQPVTSSLIGPHILFQHIQHVFFL
jgi:hypothetical protein